MKRSVLLLTAGVLLTTAALAQKETSLTRDEVSAFKKKMVAVFDALGEAPAGYALEDERFNLPTEAYPARLPGMFNPVSGSAERRYGTEKAAKKSNADMEKEYKQKMMDAQAKGDYAAMGKIGQEMQQKAMQTQMKADSAHKEPIEVQVMLNNFSGNTIDPDAVVLEKAGLIALKQEQEKGSGMGTVMIYFDPVTLKDTKQLSSVRLNPPDDGLGKATQVITAVIEFRGPLAEIEPWVKRIDTKKVLAQIEGRK